jgi:hypothetical protein
VEGIPLKSGQRALLDFLLSHDFPGRAELAHGPCAGRVIVCERAARAGRPLGNTAWSSVSRLISPVWLLPGTLMLTVSGPDAQRVESGQQSWQLRLGVSADANKEIERPAMVAEEDLSPGAMEAFD